MGVIAEEEDKEAAEEDKEGGARGMGDLQFIAAGDEFSAIPETAGGLHGQYEHGAGDKAYDPACYPILAVETALSFISLHVNKLNEYFFLIQT
jgi:hypothetical protein